MRKTYNTGFKSKVAIEAIKGERTMSELSSKFEVHRDQVQKWKRVVLTGIPGLFSGKQDKASKNNERLLEELYMQIGRLKVENDWLKKKLQLY